MLERLSFKPMAHFTFLDASFMAWQLSTHTSFAQAFVAFFFSSLTLESPVPVGFGPFPLFFSFFFFFFSFLSFVFFPCGRPTKDRTAPAPWTRCQT